MAPPPARSFCWVFGVFGILIVSGAGLRAHVLRPGVLLQWAAAWLPLAIQLLTG